MNLKLPLQRQHSAISLEGWRTFMENLCECRRMSREYHMSGWDVRRILFALQDNFQISLRASGMPTQIAFSSTSCLYFSQPCPSLQSVLRSLSPVHSGSISFLLPSRISVGRRLPPAHHSTLGYNYCQGQVTIM